MAYNAATLLSKDPQPGGIRLIIEFSGNAGEPAVRDSYLVTGDTTLAAIRQWAYQKAASLTPARTIADGLTVGQTITLTAPPAAPAATAKQVWRAKVSRYQELAGPGYTGAAQTDLAALLADINATYAAGFLDA